jgi:TolB-like protein/tetratricopeptide (TPR) repeat protein
VFGLAVVGLLTGSLWLRYTAPAASAPPPAVPAPPSVAVRPFLTLGPDLAAAPIGPALAGELVTAMGQVPGLRVADPASVRTAARGSGDPREIGRRLGVGAVLEGSVRIAGDRLRLSTHLVSVDQGFDLWSETFDQPAAELLAVRDSIARSVVSTLRPQARLHPPAATTPAAFLACLRGREALGGRGADDVEAAIAAFTEALRLDSGYSPAWAGLAEARVRELEAGVRAPAAAAEPARAAADRALALDSLDARALLARGAVRLLYDRAWAGAREDLRRAAALEPGRVAAAHRLSHLFLAEGRLDSSLAASQSAIGRSPLDAGLRVHLAWVYAMAGDDSLAATALAGAGALEGVPVTDEHAPLLLETTSDTGAAGRLAQAVALAPERLDLVAELARLHALEGRPDTARAMLARMLALADARYVSPYALALVYAALGETRPAAAALDRALREGDPTVLLLPVDPRLAALRRDPRVADLVRRLVPDTATIPAARPSPPGP